MAAATRPRALALLLPRWRLVMGAVVFAFLSAATNAGMAVLVGTVAGWLFRPNAPVPSTATWLTGASDGFHVVVGVGAVTAVRILGTLGSAWVTARLGTEIVHELRTALYERTASNALPRNLAHHRAELVSRLQNDVEVIQGTLTYAVTGFAHTVFSTMMVGALILSIDPLVGFACFVGAPLAALVVRYANRRYLALYESLRSDYGLLHGRIEEIIDVGDVVRSLGAERRMSKRFAQLSERVRVNSLALAWTSALTKPVVSILASLGITCLVLYWNLGSAPPPADQASLLAAAAILIRPVHSLSDWLESFTAARASMVRVNEILDVAELEAPRDHAASRGEVALLHANTVAFSFGQREVLSDVSFSLRRGQVLAVVGASGNGKTTLLRLVAGLLEPLRGEFLIDGVSATAMGMRDYRFHFGWVPQEARLLFDSVSENLRLGRPEASSDELRRVLKEVGLESALASFTSGLDTVVGDDGSPFSGGQRQRLCIARALVADAPILILDEPTAALDERQAEELHNTLDELRTKVGVLIATHRLSSVRRSDWVIVLEEGRIVEQGPFKELLASGKRFRRLFAQEIVSDSDPINASVG